uniref:CARMIL C-terminal domain-containing protein n=1 Tax=Anopheles stephensi TaxID=30069 RepID=A0A182YSD6_ANOST
MRERMRLPNEPKPADFARGGSLFGSLRSRLSDAMSGPASMRAAAAAPVPAPHQAPIDANGDAVVRSGAATIEVQPVVIRKTPKFPSRERHLAIRRKNRVPPAAASVELGEELPSCPGSPLSVTSGRRLSK